MVITLESTSGACLHESRGTAASESESFPTLRGWDARLGRMQAGAHVLGLGPVWGLTPLELLEVLVSVSFVRSNQGSLKLKV